MNSADKFERQCGSRKFREKVAGLTRSIDTMCRKEADFAADEAQEALFLSSFHPACCNVALSAERAVEFVLVRGRIPG